MGYSVEFRPSALKALRHIAPSNRARISKAIEALAENPYPAGCKKLADEEGFWRIRAGDYRVILYGHTGEIGCRGGQDRTPARSLPLDREGSLQMPCRLDCLRPRWPMLARFRNYRTIFWFDLVT